MKITSTLTFDATLTRSSPPSSPPELAAKRAALAKVDDYTHEVDGLDGGHDGDRPGDRPSKARKFARNGAKATITTKAAGETVTYTVDPHGVPVDVSARLTLEGAGETTTATLEADLNVKIPLIGGTVEKKAAGRADWLSGQGRLLVNAVVAGE